MFIMNISLIIACLCIASGCAIAPPTIPHLSTLLPSILQCPSPSKTTLSTISSSVITLRYYFSSSTVLDPVELTTNHLNLVDPTIPTKIIVHGWLQNETIPMYSGFRTAYAQRGSYNVITVDWSNYSNSIDYIESAYYVPKVGKVLGEFIKTLHDVTNIPFNLMHLLGLSLGAHVVGFAGKVVQATNSGSIIGRITGMDPAGPCFGMPVFKSASDRLDRSDATSVEVIHTDAGWLGIQQSIGKVDFRANTGTRDQPGCSDFLPSSFTGVLCSHNRSSELYIASILSDSMVVHLSNRNLIFGEDTPPGTTGEYYFRTLRQPPYGEN